MRCGRRFGLLTASAVLSLGLLASDTPSLSSLPPLSFAALSASSAASPSPPGPAPTAAAGPGAGAAEVVDVPSADPLTWPGSGLGEECPPVPTLLPPELPRSARCVWTVTADLDEGGRSDRLVVWNAGSGADPLADVGALAVFDDHSRRVLADVRLDGLHGHDLTPSALVDVDGDGTHEVLLRSELGASSVNFLVADVVGAGEQRRLLPVSFADGSRLGLSEGVALSHGRWLGCAVTPPARPGPPASPGTTGGGTRLVASSSFYRDLRGDERNSIVWSVDYYEVTDGVARRRGRQGGLWPGDVRSFLTWAGRQPEQCAPDATGLPVVAAPEPRTNAPRDVVTRLVAVALAGEEQTGRFLTAGWDGDPGQDIAAQDAWSALTAVPTGWLATPSAVECLAVGTGTRLCRRGLVSFVVVGSDADGWAVNRVIF